MRVLGAFLIALVVFRPLRAMTVLMLVCVR